MSKFCKLLCQVSAGNVKNYHSLQGRAILHANDLNFEDIRAILWTAKELKELDANCQPIPDVSSKFVTLLMDKDTYYSHSMYRAAHLLKMNITKSLIPGWEVKGNLQDVRRYYEVVTDLLLTKSARHDVLVPAYKTEPSSGEEHHQMPMFNLGTCRCSIICVLTDFMTYQEHFQQLCGLNILWFGEVCALLNTYIPLGFVANMNIRYHCHHMTPSALRDTLKAEFGKSEQIREYNMEKDKDFKVDVVVANERSPNWDKIMELARNHSPEMTVQRPFPTDDASAKVPLDLSKRQRRKERAGNLMYVMAAILLRLTCDHAYQTAEPSF